jgi:lipopolysaccharide transport system ATP-binding protein
MAGPAVIFEHVWKKFRRGERHDSLRDLVPSLVRRAFAGRVDTDLTQQEFWAVRDVSFEVRPGEALGIIGPNGAGKSTTLKLLTRILKPTRGRSEVHGRVGALIEVAAGFHPDLTGRENIFLQGAIMGMTRADVSRRLDEIIEFAGVSEFVDTPVKRYSSGMNARLGFSIAAHCDPAVLLVDEVLSVGDMAFQRRCLERMQGFVSSGTATVFISHDLQAIERLCTSALYIRGTVQAYGPVSDVLQAYLANVGTTPTGADSDVTIVEASLAGGNQPRVTPGARLMLRASYVSRVPVRDLTFSFVVYRSTDQLIVYGASIAGADIGADGLVPGEQLTLAFDFAAHLTRGLYHVECRVFHNPTQRHLAQMPNAASFSVAEDLTFRGVADLGLKVAVLSRHAAHAEVAEVRTLSAMPR